MTTRSKKCLTFIRSLPLTTPTLNRQHKCLSALELGLYISAETALLIVTAWCLWHPREKSPAASSVPPGVNLHRVCDLAYREVEYAPGKHIGVFPTDCNDFVDPVSRFTQTLRLWFAYFLIQWVRMFVYLIALIMPSESRFKRALNFLLDASALPLFLYWMAILVVVHVYRFAPSGKFVSLDFFSHQEHADIRKQYFDTWDATDEMPESGQYIRGQYLLGLVVYIWVVQVFLFQIVLRTACSCCLCFNKCISKKKASNADHHNTGASSGDAKADNKQN